ncbi:MAG: hypothetical protein A3I61_08250 [Acidobacteria bacterium RIFCSPLOWO2_02_FULL_68_18]|nr:MAG: hypothetical protein A3I61_08250 [Acidobacteria bacterium RIFCSPLOWO2_02_FULL_68_18]OFW51231.1 MAG: hypothetical protein A3G77_06345 [Acidobacteria bacterium RIFCSPLOWO2_12_FULL_68_19]
MVRRCVRWCDGATVRWCVAAALLAASAGLLGQDRPDLSGSWKLNQAKSSAGATGNNAKVSFPSELVVTQQAGAVHVEIRYPRTDAVKATYTLDGSEVAVPIPGVTEKARAAWDGDRFLITARRVVSTPFGDFTTDSKEIWTRTGDILTIQKTQSSDGLSETETAVFDRSR